VKGAEKETVATYMKQDGYRTLFAGKYTNMYGLDKYGTKHVPPGWIEWLGLVGNSRYYDYTVSHNGNAVKHGHDYHKDYFTDLIANHTVKFIKEQDENYPTDPQFLWVANAKFFAFFSRS